MSGTTKLRDNVLQLLKFLEIPGAIVSVQSDVYDSFTLEYGYADLVHKIPMSTDYSFRIGSITKTFTGIVLLQLYQEGLINLDDPVSKYLQCIPNGDNITIRQIGEMRSGIFNYVDADEFIALDTSEPLRYWLPSELYTLGITKPVYFNPGADFHYANTNTIILALIIERITKNSIQDEICHRIFKPLRLNDTVFANTPEAPRQMMRGYQYDAAGKLSDVTRHSTSYAWAAGAIYTNFHDLSKYIKLAIGDGILLGADALQQQRLFKTSEYVKGLEGYYGFQLMALEDFIGHNGNIPGFNTYALYEINTETTIIIVANANNTSPNNVLFPNAAPANIVGQYIVSNFTN